jgi:hypothetical protein
MSDWYYAMIYEGYWRPYDHTGDRDYYGNAGWFPSAAAVCATLIQDLANDHWGTKNGVIALYSLRQHAWIIMNYPVTVMSHICTSTRIARYDV